MSGVCDFSLFECNMQVYVHFSFFKKNHTHTIVYAPIDCQKIRFDRSSLCLKQSYKLIIKPSVIDFIFLSRRFIESTRMFSNISAEMTRDSKQRINQIKMSPNKVKNLKIIKMHCRAKQIGGTSWTLIEPVAERSSGGIKKKKNLIEKQNELVNI